MNSDKKFQRLKEAYMRCSKQTLAELLALRDLETKEETPNSSPVLSPTPQEFNEPYTLPKTEPFKNPYKDPWTKPYTPCTITCEDNGIIHSTYSSKKGNLYDNTSIAL